MPITALLTILKNPTVLKYGAIILVLISLIAGTAYYIETVRTDGYEKGRLYERDIWVKKENSDKSAQEESDKKHKAELAKIEAESHAAANEHQTKMRSAEAKIRELNRKLEQSKIDIPSCPVPGSAPSTEPPKTIECKPGEAVQMGTDFSTQWNEYNKVLK